MEPDRTSTGQPVYWIDINPTTFEVWPVPDGVYTLRLWYNITVPELVNESDVPLVPERLLLAHARMASYLQMAAAKSQYRDLYTLTLAEYNELLEAAVEEDMRKLSLPNRVIVDGPHFPQSNDYWLSHDVMDPRRMR
ncbi:MAG: hypothetical protein K6T85_01745 [Gorillibacterium sp.]|nr:hypothetical protein [Gorillibacterium sp.]